MRQNKRGLELTLSTMVISILVLTVLVVLILIFTGVIGGVFVPGLNNCLEKGGECKAAVECGFGKDYARTVGKCDQEKYPDTVCCIKVSK